MAGLGAPSPPNGDHLPHGSDANESLMPCYPIVLKALRDAFLKCYICTYTYVYAFLSGPSQCLLVMFNTTHFLSDPSHIQAGADPIPIRQVHLMQGCPYFFWLASL